MLNVLDTFYRFPTSEDNFIHNLSLHIVDELAARDLYKSLSIQLSSTPYRYLQFYSKTSMEDTSHSKHLYLLHRVNPLLTDYVMHSYIIPFIRYCSLSNPRTKKMSKQKQQNMSTTTQLFDVNECSRKAFGIQEKKTNEENRNIFKNTQISMRTMSWFLTNYAPRHDEEMQWKPPLEIIQEWPRNEFSLLHSGDKKIVIIGSEIQSMKRHYGNEFFDIFRRGLRVIFEVKNTGEILESTPSQLNAILFCVKFTLFEYVISVLDCIEEDKSRSIKRARNNKKRNKKNRMKICPEIPMLTTFSITTK